jgi:glycosyltransferase involved in cell wall biosynthesis
MEQRLVRLTDGVLTIDSSGDVVEERYKKYNDAVRVLYNVPDPGYQIDQADVDHLKNRYQDRPIALYIGGISMAKGMLKALEAAEYLVQKTPEALFLFVGTFLGDTENIFRSFVSSSHLENNVEFISWLPYEKMLPYLAVSKVGLALHQPVPRYYLVSRGNGRKFFTYMEVGLPVIAPDFGEVSRVVEEESAGILIDTTDPQKIAETVRYLFENPEEARKMGQNGRRAISEKYNWEIESQKVVDFYRQFERV